jgi:hypothetical protein
MEVGHDLMAVPACLSSFCFVRGHHRNWAE